MLLHWVFFTFCRDAVGDTAKVAGERKDPLLAALGQIALMRRSASVHLIIALQRPDANVLGGAIRHQSGLRITLGWLSQDGLGMMLEGPAASNPPDGRVLAGPDW